MKLIIDVSYFKGQIPLVFRCLGDFSLNDLNSMQDQLNSRNNFRDGDGIYRFIVSWEPPCHYPGENIPGYWEFKQIDFEKMPKNNL